MGQVLEFESILLWHNYRLSYLLVEQDVQDKICTLELMLLILEVGSGTTYVDVDKVPCQAKLALGQYTFT